MKKIILSILTMTLVIGGLTSCSEDRLDSTLDNSVDNQKRPATTETELRALLTGAYSRMVTAEYYGRDIIIFGEVRGDNAYGAAGFSNRFTNVSNYTLTPTSAYPANTWELILKVVSSANLALESDIKVGDETKIAQYKAEAYALRAIAHFDLLRLYGQQHVGKGGYDALGVPYIVKFADLDKKNYTRKSVGEVKDLIYKDLDAALEIISSDISNKKRINKQSVLGFKSRIALYFGSFDVEQYQIAAATAKEALSLGGSVVTRNGFIDSFKAGEPQVNSVFDLFRSNVENSGNNSLFTIYSYDGYGDVVGIGENLEKLFADKNDIRSSLELQDYKYLVSTTGKYIKGKDGVYVEIKEGENVGTATRYNREQYRNFGKYPKRESSIRVLRFEELVLNYVEASLRNGGLDAEASALYNELLTARYGEGKVNTTAVSIADVIEERRKEFVFEGFRFDDLMRIKQDLPSTPVMTSGVKYGDAKLAFPIPQNEINVSGIEQNAL